MVSMLSRSAGVSEANAEREPAREILSPFSGRRISTDRIRVESREFAAKVFAGYNHLFRNKNLIRDAFRNEFSQCFHAHARKRGI